MGSSLDPFVVTSLWCSRVPVGLCSHILDFLVWSAGTTRCGCSFCCTMHSLRDVAQVVTNHPPMNDSIDTQVRSKPTRVIIPVFTAEWARVWPLAPLYRSLSQTCACLFRQEGAWQGVAWQEVAWRCTLTKPHGLQSAYMSCTCPLVLIATGLAVLLTVCAALRKQPHCRPSRRKRSLRLFCMHDELPLSTIAMIPRIPEP
jgi:hypothetical protein